MASYLRSLFGGYSSNGNSQSKSHKRSTSTPSASTNANLHLNHIYSSTGAAPSITSTRTSRERSNSYGSRTNTPSPLRYATYDSGSLRARDAAAYQQEQSALYQAQHPPPQQQRQTTPQKKARVHMYRSVSHKPGEPPAPYPIYSHSASYTSVHSASSSSIHPGSSISGHRPAAQRSSSSGSVAASEPRPALKQYHTWQPGTKSAPQPHAHVSFMNPNRRVTMHMHPLLAYSRLHKPPISYDVTFTPSSHTVVDRSTHSSIPKHTLAQPATEPPTYSKLILKSDRLPWPIVVTSAESKPAARFYLGGPTNATKHPSPITNLDVLYALHNTLSLRVTQQEWEALGHGSRAQRKVTRAYEKRCFKMGGGWDGGVRRIDFLGEKTRLAGIEVDKSAESSTGKLVFSKA